MHPLRKLAMERPKSLMLAEGGKLPLPNVGDLKLFPEPASAIFMQAIFVEARVANTLFSPNAQILLTQNTT